jgi:fucose permease
MLRKDVKVPARSAAISIQIAFAFFAFIMIGLNDGAGGVLIPSIQAHYGVDKATVSLNFLCSTAGYLTAAFTSGPLVEKLGKRRLLLLGIALFLLGAAGLSLVPPFPIFALLLFPVGCGIGILDAGLNTHIASLPRSTTVLNLLHAFYGVGALVGPTLASALLVAGLPWNNIYTFWLFLGLLLLVGILLSFKTSNNATAHGETKEEGNVMLATLRTPIVWISALFLLLYVGLEVSLGTWCYSYLTEERHLSALYGGWVNSGYWLGLTLGRLVLGGFIQRFGEKRAIQLCVIGVVVGMLIAWLVPSSALAAIALCWTGFCLGPLFPTMISLMSQLVSSRLLASAIGFLASLGSVGAALFPWLAGNLVQHIGLWVLMPFAMVVALLMLVSWLMVYAHPHQQQA